MDNNNKFDAPQIIGKDRKTFGLDKQEQSKISYIELQKDENDRFKRTDNKLETSPAELTKGIKEGTVKIIMPSKSFMQESSRKEFEDNFKAPSIIGKGDRTFGFEKQDQKKLSYIELSKDTGTWKRTENKFETEISDLAKGIKDGSIKVVRPHKDYLAEKSKQNEEIKATEAKKEKEKIEIKPIVVEPLNARERKEVKEAFQEGRLENEKHATNLFKKFDKQLESVPDKVQGNSLTNQDKLKLLVGDYSDHQNTKFTVEKDKTVSMEGKEKGLLTNANSQFSERQIEKQSAKEQQKANAPALSV
ncbi:hypothetical protein [Dyadobacter alkalitolerans]|uniref:hypothetical protein n=1 Tax=Dyadobacter alkalitolerans TaxID=492736 RepID=UPI00041122CA|nr:hypothetical protein [Dyadobacter alkalitolerans]